MKTKMESKMVRTLQLSLYKTGPILAVVYVALYFVDVDTLDH